MVSDHFYIKCQDLITRSRPWVPGLFLNDPTHFGKIVITLGESIRFMRATDKVIDTHAGGQIDSFQSLS